LIDKAFFKKVLKLQKNGLISNHVSGYTSVLS